MKYNKIAVMAFVLVPMVSGIILLGIIFLEDNPYIADYHVLIIHDIMAVALFPLSLICGTILGVMSFIQIKKSGEKGRLLSMICMVSGLITIFLLAIAITRIYCLIPGDFFTNQCWVY